MAFTSDDTFTIPSLAALGMSETLVLLLNAMIRNLPEPELRTLRATLQESVNTADDILYNMMISSTFEMLSVSGSKLTHPLVSIYILNSLLSSVHHLWRGRVRHQCPRLSCRWLYPRSEAESEWLCEPSLPAGVL